MPGPDYYAIGSVLRLWTKGTALALIIVLKDILVDPDYAKLSLG